MQEIRTQASSALIRAAERAERTGAPARAATSYLSAAQLTQTDTPEGQRTAGMLWERAAEGAITDGDYAAADNYAAHACQHYRDGGDARAAARALVIAGRGLRLRGRLAEAREQLTGAAEILRADPDTDTVRVLEELAIVEVFAGSPEADRATSEVLNLGQALDVGIEQLAGLFLTRGLYHEAAERRPQAVAYLREAARLAEQAGDTVRLGRVLLNLSDAVSVTDPVAAVEAAQTAAGYLRQAGLRDYLAGTIMNLVQALLLLGDWDTADDELTAAEADGLADMERLVSCRGWLAALRGASETAENLVAALPGLRASEDPQDIATVNIIEAFTAAARHQLADALCHARSALAHVSALGISHECLRWGWPLAARSALELGDIETVSELLDLLDSFPRGYVAPMLRGEADLVRARLADGRVDPDAPASFVSAIASLRAHSTPYHLAHGLLDHAGQLLRAGDADAAAGVMGEARDIASRLRCQPLLDRAVDLTRAADRTPAGDRSPG